MTGTHREAADPGNDDHPEQVPTLDRLGLRPISPVLGAEVVGMEPGMFQSPALGPFLRQALRDHQLLVVRGLSLDATDFRRLGLSLGPLRPVPDGMRRELGLSDVQRLSNVSEDGVPSGTHPDPYSLHWHADGTATPIPSRFTLLYAQSIPQRGGETHFADMYAACAAMDPEQRRKLLGRKAIHDPELARHFRYGGRTAPDNLRLRDRFRMRLRFIGRLLSPYTTRHPVICVHEETGKACLFVGDHAWRVTGCRWATGMRLIEELNAFATTNPRWIFTHSWRVGDLLIWDNRCLLHRGSEYDTSRERRVMLRAVVNGGERVLQAAPPESHGSDR